MEPLCKAIDDLIEFVKAADERELCHRGALCRGILHSERRQFDELDQRVYTLAFAAGLKDELPKPVDSEGLTFTPDAPLLLPLFFLGKTNLPGNWGDGIFSFVNEASWQQELLLLRSLADRLPESTAPEPGDSKLDEAMLLLSGDRQMVFRELWKRGTLTKQRIDGIRGNGQTTPDALRMWISRLIEVFDGHPALGIRILKENGGIRIEK